MSMLGDNAVEAAITENIGVKAEALIEAVIHERVVWNLALVEAAQSVATGHHTRTLEMHQGDPCRTEKELLVNTGKSQVRVPR